MNARKVNPPYARGYEKYSDIIDDGIDHSQEWIFAKSCLSCHSLLKGYARWECPSCQKPLVHWDYTKGEPVRDRTFLRNLVAKYKKTL